MSNFLSTTSFGFSLHRFPNMSLNVQRIVLPDLSIGISEAFTPFKTIYKAGDKPNYGELTISAINDENLNLYTDIINWMEGLVKPNSFDQYKKLQESEAGLYSDATLIIMNSKKNPNITFQFQDIFPISINNIELDATQTGIQYSKLDITFKHNGFTRV